LLPLHRVSHAGISVSRRDRAPDSIAQCAFACSFSSGEANHLVTDSLVFDRIRIRATRFRRSVEKFFAHGENPMQRVDLCRVRRAACAEVCAVIRSIVHFRDQ
jgi:hypothetical protein